MFTDMPEPFKGTKEEMSANYASHSWLAHDSDVFCIRCDCSPGGILADYPCGTDVPRVLVEIGESSAFRFVD